MSATHTVSRRKAFMLAIAGSAALLALGSSVQAGEAMPQKAVQYDDLDLTQAADAKRLYQRLRAAANSVCSTYSGRELRLVTLRKECVATALNSAVLEVNQATVFALHDAKKTIQLAEKPSMQATPRS
jgi:UrcA family protein